MGSISESISTVNSLVRTTLALTVVGGVGAAGWFGYSTINEREIREHELLQVRTDLQDAQRKLSEAEGNVQRMREEVAQKEREIARLGTAMRLLKVDHRAARLTVLDQEKDAESGEVISRVEFVELDDRGHEMDKPREFSIRGELVYIDSWIVKFDDKYVEQADLHRATSLVLFKRIYGEKQEPIQGFVLDPAGVAPRVYAQGDRPSEFAQKIFSDFWQVANDNKKQQELGIRAAHGTADYIKVEKGKSYKVQIRSSGDVTIDPDDNAPPRVGTAG